MTTPPDPFAAPSGQEPPQQPAQQPPPLPQTPSPWGQPPAGYGPPPPAGYGYGPPAGYPSPYGPQTGTNGMAIASLCTGIVGCFYGIPAILAIIFGFVARSQIKQRPQAGGGMALAGIILGFVWIVIGIGLIVALVVGGFDSSSCSSTSYGSDGTSFSTSC